MSARDIVGGLAGAAISAAKSTAKDPIGTAKKVVGTGVAASEAVAHTAADRLRQRAGHAAEKASEAEQAAEDLAAKAGEDEPAPEQPEQPEEPAEQPSAEQEEPAEEREPQVVLREPGPPEEPPVNIVEQVLAEEAAAEGAGRVTEPRGASRDEEHGDAALQRAEAEEILEETAEAFPEGAVDVETPVGTTGADTAYNPDTAEADLQQPGTAPLVDDATTKAVKSESETLEAAAGATARKRAPRKATPKTTAKAAAKKTTTRKKA